MSDSAPRQAAEAGAKQTAAKQTKAAKANPGEASAGEASPGEASTAEPGKTAANAEAQQGGTPGADGKPDMDEVKRKFREALDRKREIQADGSGAGGRNTGKIHGAHGSEDHRRTFRRKSG